jgi:hypothetical protein
MIEDQDFVGIGMQLPEKYKRNLCAWSEDPSSAVSRIKSIVNEELILLSMSAFDRQRQIELNIGKT